MRKNFKNYVFYKLCVTRMTLYIRSWILTSELFDTGFFSY